MSGLLGSTSLAIAYAHIRQGSNLSRRVLETLPPPRNMRMYYDNVTLFTTDSSRE